MKGKRASLMRAVLAGISLTLTVLPGLALSITVLSFALLGDALRDALDPRGSVRSPT